jgi:hypothetical protein
VEDDVDAAHQLAHERRVADVALDDLDVAVGQRPGQVLAAAAHEVVEHDDLARLLLDDEVGDVRADHAGAARDQHAIPA